MCVLYYIILLFCFSLQPIQTEPIDLSVTKSEGSRSDTNEDSTSGELASSGKRTATADPVMLFLS